MKFIIVVISLYKIFVLSIKQNLENQLKLIPKIKRKIKLKF